MRRRIVACLAMALVCASCVGGSHEAVPRGLSKYLEALRRHDYRTAYDLTQLSDLVHSFGAGASLSFEHFAAFYAANPLRRYQVGHVARSEIRSIDAVHQKGTPYFEVEVSLEYPDGPHDETFTVEGEILPTVQVEPDRVLVSLAAQGARSIVIDGITTTLSTPALRVPAGAHSLLLLKGRHELRAGTQTITLATNPLRVLAGPGAVSGSPPVVLIGAVAS